MGYGIVSSKTVGVKLDDEMRAKIMERCTSKGCNVSTYLRNLIDKDIAWPVEDGKLRIRFEHGNILLPCSRCGHPVPFGLGDMRLART